MPDGDRQGATARYEEAPSVYRDVGNALSTALCLVNLGNRAKAEGRPEPAQAHTAGSRLLIEAAVAEALQGSPPLEEQ